MLLRNGNKERLICTKHALCLFLPKTTKTTPPLRVLREVIVTKRIPKGKNSNFQIYLRKLCALGSFFAFLINVTSSSFSLLSLLLLVPGKK